MATLLAFHAHPDDESIATGGVIAAAHDAGHRVILVVATKGEHGEVADGYLDDGETLGERRVKETHASADVLGIDRVEFLGYTDSGMIGTDTNDAPECFWQADVEEASQRLAEILREESVDVLTIYDVNGNYGHPDHIQVHRVGVRAAELAGVHSVFEATMNRDSIKRQFEEADASETFADVPAEERPNPNDFDHMGSAEHEITHRVDVGAHVEAKKASMRCHASQITESSFFLRMPDEVFRNSFGYEWFIERGAPRSADEPFRTSLFA